jgi:hypothetical protein
MGNVATVTRHPVDRGRALTAAGVLDELEQELLATLSEFDNEAVGLAVLDAVERVRTRTLVLACGA